MLKLLCLATLLLAAPAKLDAQAELKAVLTLVLSDKSIAQYLAHYKQGELTGYCKTLPVYNESSLKPAGVIFCRDGQVIRFTTHAAQVKLNQAVLVLDSVKVNAQQASVLLHIPTEGVTGKYLLRRQTHWAITSAEVYER